MLVLVLQVMFTWKVQARIFLVSAGISDYPGTRLDLRLPAADAKTIAWLYSKNSNVMCQQLLNQQATTQGILRTMNQLYTQAGPSDIIVFFFSGHGYPGGFASYDGRFTYEQVRQAMARGRCDNKIIFADACFSGKIATDGSSGQSAVAAAQKANVMLFLSSRSNETSIERSDMANGFFTTYLQKGLRGGADRNRDRIITARELYNYVHDGVIKISKGRQHPVMWGHFNDNMPVMQWKNK